MSACEVCWDLAYVASRLGPESQVEAYHRLLRENEGEPGHAGTAQPHNPEDSP